MGDTIFQVFIALIAAFVLPAAYAGESSVQAPCPEQAVFHDDGAASGCQTIRSDGLTVRVGIWTWRNAQGQVLREVSYDEEGLVHGLAKVWNPPGRNLEKPAENLRQSRRYFHGRWHGVTEFWTADGKPDGARCFVCGERAKLGECTFDAGSEQDFALRCAPVLAIEKGAKLKRSGRAPAGL